ncbi:transmembrane and TPR repeat-containing protein CG4050-like protein [Dinothrombium tinctorium]|uniref:dolichyl-phosphate-mannose--protein mannosyltransferase n=1 Tax=Dinothrombium tinctorium TaxID=1965070 RepID=A0A443R710_9ACAR|nr:transmembrane and TPR repeat-containing protein CG4050-like protein [Dinothrombium tinctorium]
MSARFTGKTAINYDLNNGSMSRNCSTQPSDLSNGSGKCFAKVKNGERTNVPPRWHWLLVAAVAFTVYSNSLKCGFAFDDMSAIRDNRDLRPQTSVLQLFINDFWGTQIRKEQSHKSYRPLCVLTFRLNYLIHELRPFGYHLVNVVLHVVVCLIYHRLCNIFMPHIASLVSALLFAVHPVHSEAVTGVVGRAELLSTMFFLFAFHAYINATKRRSVTCWSLILLCVILTVLATLCKEQGITVIAVCLFHELFIGQKINLASILQSLKASKTPIPQRIKESFLRIIVLVISTLCILVFRLQIMGSQLPVFTKFDNPAAAAETPTRQLTYNFLLAANAWLLLFPFHLCCDWTMGTIMLIESVFDARNMATLLFYVVFAVLIWNMVRRSEPILVLGLSLIIFPFLPASNLFFPVGFVIAERVLYIPSTGFCMMVGYGWFLLFERFSDNNNNNEKTKRPSKKLLVTALVVVLCMHFVRTMLRNEDWENEYSIFVAGLKVTQRNAKLYNNVGHALESEGKYLEALQFFLKAVDVQPDDIGAHMNVGRTYNNLNEYELAETAFRKAKSLLPRPRPGERYQARVAPSHLNVFLNLANLIARNKSRLEEADALYRQAISMRADYTQAYINRGDVLIKMNRTQEAQEVYEKALLFDSSNPDIYYNLGVVLLEQGKATQALVYFNKALELEPLHEQALMNSAILIQESGRDELRPIAIQRLYQLIEKGKSNERVYFNLGMLAMDAKDYSEGEKWFRLAIEAKEDFRSALFNLALLLSDSNRPLEAVPFLKQLLRFHPDHVKGLILLGDIYINHVKDLDAAERCYKQIVKLDPKNVQGQHNLCVVYVERGHLNEAEQCLEKVSEIAPNENYVIRHLKIVRSRIMKLKQQKTNASKGLS